MNYIRLHFIYPNELQELFIAELLDMDFEGFEQESDLLIASIPQQRYDDTKREAIERMMIMNHIEGGLIKEEVVEPQNWNQQWEQTIKPQMIGDFLVHPTWERVTDHDAQYEIILDPKMAFGTGYHETTQLMLENLPALVEKGAKVLDAGTGTGILAIASVMLGAESAFGFDIDEWSKDNAEENAELNEVTDQCMFELGSIEVIPKGDEYGLILANINRNALKELMPGLRMHLAEGGTILLSGLLAQDEEEMLKVAEMLKLKHIKTLSKKEWIAMILEDESGH
jgi:ribosomal protein L11 methyltransferase